MHVKNNQTPNEIHKENSSSKCISEVVENDEEEKEDLNATYSDAFSNAGDLSFPLPRMIKVLKRKHFVKGQG